MTLPDPSPLTPQELARLGLNRFVAIDLETTGTDARTDRCIELGAVLFEGGQEVARFSELVEVEQELPPFITRLTGITEQDLLGKGAFDQHAAPFFEFIGDAPLVGQNIRFDISFLEAEHSRLEAGSRPTWQRSSTHDTLFIARVFFPTLGSYGLGALCRALGVELTDAHRAVHDAAATGRVLLELLARARRTPFGELNELNRITGGASFEFGGLLDGIAAIGPGELGAEEPGEMRENRIGDFQNELEPSGEEIDEEWFEGFFAANGPLAAHVPDYQLREGQRLMARHVSRSLHQGGALIAEAGTGTGKSFAYLVSSYLHAKSTGQRVVISTYTRHLQNQLFDKDIPTIRKALGGGVRAVLLKGRGNYICKRRYEALVADPDSLEVADRLALLPLVRWIARTRTGDIGEASGFRRWQAPGLWGRITADSGLCSARVCRASQGCFLHRIRTAAQRAHLVLVNHALLFSDLASGGGVLGEYDRVVLDEAHHLEKVAADQLGIRYSGALLLTSLGRLYDKSSKRGLLVNMRSLAPLLRSPLERGSSEDEGPIEGAITAMEELVEHVKDWDRELLAYLESVGSATDDRGYTRKTRYNSGEEVFAPIMGFAERLKASFKSALKVLADLDRELEEALEGPMEGDDLPGEYRRLQREVIEWAAMFERLVGPPQENMVFWYELPKTGSREGVSLFGSPLDASELLRELYYPKLHALVLTSATLTVEERFDYIKKRLGLEEAEGAIYDSPFDMRGQLYIAVADFLGLPNQNLDRYTRGVARLAYRLPNELDAGTLVLFTSQKMLGAAYDDASPLLERAGRMTLAQGLSGAAAELLERFRESRPSVLFGLDSFWEGIDVPGESLELAILARLPFQVPTDPVVQARGEHIEAQGGNPFMEYTLPEAALKLRQGIGRLIRRSSDVGVAVICDPRISTSRWGAILARSLPVKPVVYREYDELFADLHRFLKG